MSSIREIILIIWQLPQYIVAVIFYMYLKLFKDIYDIYMDKPVIVIISNGLNGEVTIGSFIFMGKHSTDMYKHALGHVAQSRVLGPLYLLVIGLPSIIHAGIHDRWCKNKNYYHFYTEKFDWVYNIVGDI